jgi:hypothetical protein
VVELLESRTVLSVTVTDGAQLLSALAGRDSTIYLANDINLGPNTAQVPAGFTIEPAPGITGAVNVTSTNNFCAVNVLGVGTAEIPITTTINSVSFTDPVGIGLNVESGAELFGNNLAAFGSLTGIQVLGTGAGGTGRCYVWAFTASGNSAGVFVAPGGLYYQDGGLLNNNAQAVVDRGGVADVFNTDICHNGSTLIGPGGSAFDTVLVGGSSAGVSYFDDDNIYDNSGTAIVADLSPNTVLGLSADQIYGNGAALAVTQTRTTGPGQAIAFLEGGSVYDNAGCGPIVSAAGADVTVSQEHVYNNVSTGAPTIQFVGQAFPSSLTMWEDTIDHNVAGSPATPSVGGAVGAVLTGVTTLTGADQVSLTDDTIADNAVYGIGGGAAFTLAPGHYSSVPTALVQSSTFVGNTAKPGQQPCQQSGLGGGIANGARTSLAPVALTVDNSFIAGNTATRGPDVFGPAIGGYTTVGDGDGSTGWGATDTVYAIVQFTPLSQFGGLLPTVEVVTKLTGDPAEGGTIGADNVVRARNGAFPPGADGAYGTAGSDTITAGSLNPCNPTGGTGSNPTGGSGSNPTGGSGSNPTGGSGSNSTGGSGSNSTGGSGSNSTGGSGSNPTGGSGSNSTGGSGSNSTGGSGSNSTGGSGSATGTNPPPNMVPVHKHDRHVKVSPPAHHHGHPVVHHVPVVHHHAPVEPHHGPVVHRHAPAGPMRHRRLVGSR